MRHMVLPFQDVLRLRRERNVGDSTEGESKRNGEYGSGFRASLWGHGGVRLTRCSERSV